MEYICLDCGHPWNALERVLGYRQCPNVNCRSYDVVPASFSRMVEVAREQGISHNTPVLDVMKSCQAVIGQESLLKLGFLEFMRIMKRVIDEVENTARQDRPDMAVQK